MNSNFPCSIIKQKQLTDLENTQLQELVHSCCIHENIHLSYPDEPGTAYYFLYHKQENTNRLISAVTVLPYNDTLAECIGFTLPDFRRKGCFSALFDKVLEDFDETDLIFPLSNQTCDACAVLDHMGAELQSSELAMELSLDDTDIPTAISFHSSLNLSLMPFGQGSEEEILQLFQNGSLLLGSCRLSPVGNNCCCLHHVEILEAYRGQGFGSAMISLLIPYLASRNVCRLILQVSGDNHSALALYKKTGFRITETLFYYLY